MIENDEIMKTALQDINRRATDALLKMPEDAGERWWHLRKALAGIGLAVHLAQMRMTSTGKTPAGEMLKRRMA